MSVVKQLTHTANIHSDDGLEQIQVFEAITCRLVGGRESSPVPELPESLKKHKASASK